MSSELNEQLDYIEENDEHADIAAGDRIIDESLVDELLDNAETNAETAEAETQSSEAGQDTVLHKQLLALKERVSHEIEVHGSPLCYLKGDFYDRPSHPVFALQRSKDRTGLNPNQLYWRKTDLNVPVVNHFPRMGLMIIQLLAESELCQQIFFYLQIDSSVILGGVIPAVAPATKEQINISSPNSHAYISSRGAISKLMMSQMANTFATRFGPAPFSELVSEIQHKSHADSELMYFAAANFYGQGRVKPYSAFHDPTGYAGCPLIRSQIGQP
ncbi:hypothetical protein FB451DRAFT_1434299 [Mycena latifolia]|nr:hypothetical protein FB451DRAFT_1434299 [Mycena latifolia]